MAIFQTIIKITILSKSSISQFISKIRLIQELFYVPNKLSQIAVFNQQNLIWRRKNFGYSPASTGNNRQMIGRRFQKHYTKTLNVNFVINAGHQKYISQFIKISQLFVIYIVINKNSAGQFFFFNQLFQIK